MAATGDATITTQGDGVQVTKRVVKDTGRPTIELTVTADRSAPARITLIDRVPAGSTGEDVRFRSDAGESHWSIESDRLVFERVLEPDESYTTGYAVSGLDSGEVDAERLPPYLAVEPIDPGAPTPTRGDGSGPGDDGEVEQRAGAPANGGPTSPEMPDADDADPPPPAADPDGSVVERLLAEIDAGNVDDEMIDELREALVGAERPMEVRVKHLQQEVADLAAYTGAIEEFLETYGSEGGPIEALERELAAVRNDVAELAETVSRLDEELAGASRRMDELDGVETQVDHLQADVSTMAETVDDLESFAERFRSFCGDLAEGNGPKDRE